MKSNFKKLLFFMLTIIFIILVCYLIGEITIYVLYRNEMALFPRYVTGVNYNGFKIRRNVPNTKYRHKSYDGSWQFRINSQGFRSDINFEYYKQNDLIRILVLGDSFTIGYEVNQNETYSMVLEKYLKNKNIDVEVINSGVSGFSNAEELIFFEQEGIKYNPDILILGFYSNDITDNIRANLFKIVNDSLVLNKKEYLPAIKIRNFLNSFFIYRKLSEYSYLHNYLNNIATVYFKNKLVKQNLAKIEISNSLKNKQSNISLSYEERLTYEIIKRIGNLTNKNNIYFILLDIPNGNLKPSFPNNFSAEEICDYYLNSSKLLLPFKNKVKLYRPHGHGHWAEKSHYIVGEHLGKVIEKILRENLCLNYRY